MRSNRILIIVISLLLFSIVFIPNAYAEENQTQEVGISSLNVRSGPSKSAEIIGQLGIGDRVGVFKTTYGWAQTYIDGKEAWVASQYLNPVNNGTQTKEKPETVQEDIVVTENNVRIRIGPGTDHSIIGTANTGDAFSLVETANEWHKISIDDGSAGWIAAWLTNSPTKKQNTQTSTQSTGSLNGHTIVIDPGHGGKDPGAIGFNGVSEKSLTISTAKKVAGNLRQAGANVQLTRTDDYYISLEERVQISNTSRTSAFISLHYNAFPIPTVQGIGTYYYTDGKDRNLAQDIQTALAKNVSLKDRGVLRGDYHVLRENSDLAVLVELGFVTNPSDLSKIQTLTYQSNVANAITQGFSNYFNK